MHGIKETILQNICIGCGACTYVTEGRISTVINKDGMYTAIIEGAEEEDFALAEAVCPFSDGALNEDEISERIHTDYVSRHPFLGAYTKTFAGRVSDLEYLEGSSSGGITSWLLNRLLTQGVVDAVLNVAYSGTGALFSYQVNVEPSNAAQRKSRYYSTTLYEALAVVRQRSGKYALVGVPCFIKAARLIAEQDPVIKNRVVFYVGLVCGHMKTNFFAQSMAWQLGIKSNELENVDFRVKHRGRAASDYDFGALRVGENCWRYSRSLALLGSNWGHGVFQPEACNFCDDIFAETADVAFGDAWLPGYREDWRGTNVIVSRSKVIDKIIEEGERQGELQLDDIDPETVAQSQAGSFRHRRTGVAVRAYDDLRQGLSVPHKRIPPTLKGVGRHRLKVIRARRELSRISFQVFREAKEKDDLNIYMDTMHKEIAKYDKIYMPLWKSIGSAIKRICSNSSKENYSITK